jgi:hypothetical protein
MTGQMEQTELTAQLEQQVQRVYKESPVTMEQMVQTELMVQPVQQVPKVFKV